MSNSFHSESIIIGDRLLAERESTAQKQDDIILSIYEGRPTEMLAASEIESVVHAQGKTILLTSVRRSLTNLTKKNKLVKCKAQRATANGGTECYHRLFIYGGDKSENASADLSKYQDARQGQPVTLKQMVTEVKREIAYREWVYPKRVAADKMGAEEASRQIEVMRCVLTQLQKDIPKQGEMF